MKEFIQNQAIPAPFRCSLSLGANSGADRLWVSCQERFFGFLGQPGFCNIWVLADGPNIASTIYAAISLIAPTVFTCVAGAQGGFLSPPDFPGWRPPGVAS